MNTTSITVSTSVAVPVDQLCPLIADVRRWPRWGPFTPVPGDRRNGRPQAIRLGRRLVRLQVTAPDAPYWLRYEARTAGFSHTADVTLSPTEEGGTEVSWRARLDGGLPGIAGRRRSRLAAEVARLLAALASYAEDAPTTRLEWAELAVATEAKRTEPALAA